MISVDNNNDHDGTSAFGKVGSRISCHAEKPGLFTSEGKGSDSVLMALDKLPVPSLCAGG